ncbi:MAG TPA: tetratricopeptide repeat protein [Spirochaetales bacterium]|nr:tetratricopeptide repeat protein [Spirochaetales bacterium]
MSRAAAARLALAVALASASCVGGPEPRSGTSLSSGTGQGAIQGERAAVEAAIALGSPSSLELAVELAEAASAIPQADARAYGWVAYEMARLVYPELAGGLPPSSMAPPDSPLVRAFIDARNGKQVAPSAAAGPLFELFPALAVFRIKTTDSAGATLAAVERFNRFGLPSAAAELARGIALERSGDLQGAYSAYARAEEAANDCYPATLGGARMLVGLGRGEEALEVASRLDARIVESVAGRRVKAMALYQAKRWAEALPLITAVLLDDPLDSRFALMRAHLLIERGEYKQAAPLLDAYASINPDDRLYILLRARIAMESAKDRSQASAALRRGLTRYPSDPELTLYAAELFAGGDPAERAEALALAQKAYDADPSSIRALRLLLGFDLAAGDYTAAAAKADAVLASGMAFGDTEALYRSYRGAGRSVDALALARSWRAKEPGSEAAAVALATSMVDLGQKAAASELIGTLLASKGTPAYRSTLYWLQSRLQPGDEAALSSLRSALVENGMNIDALAAMSDIYVRRGDYQRARFYLKQAIAISPDRADIVERRNVLAQLGVAIP